MLTTVWQVALDSAPAAISGLATSPFLRQLLAQTLGVAAQDLVIARDGNGKPSLQHPQRLEFSVSHSGRFAIVAIGEGTPLGVDVERLRPLPSAEREALLAALCDDAARSEFARLDPPEAQQKFFSLWTRREAIAKALGQGVDALADIERRVHAEHWTIATLPMPADYAATLAIAAPGARYAIRQWRHSGDNFSNV